LAPDEFFGKGWNGMKNILKYLTKKQRRKPPRVIFSWRIFPLLSIIFLPLVYNNSEPVVAQTGPSIYWGAYMDGEHYGLGDAPWITETIDNFEASAGKRVSIIHWGQFWHWSRQSGYAGIGDGKFQKFDTGMMEKVRLRGGIPMLNWNSWSADAGGSANQPDYQLIDIINGNYDAYIRAWARDAKAWGKPFFLRMNHEMNGNWYPWSERTNGNQPGEYVRMWRHVHDIFVQEGATNVTWVWSVNVIYSSASSNLADLYPGDAYVDWVAIDGYNWGTNPSKPDSWKSFSQVMSETYNVLGQMAASKPVMLSEFASTEYGGSKANWITDALATQIPNNFPRIKAIVWFNWNIYEGSGVMDWVIETSSSAKTAFAQGIQSQVYAANTFANMPAGKIPPLSPVNPSPTSTPAGPTATLPPSPTATLGATLPPAPTATLAATIPPGSNLILNASYEATGSSWLTPWNLVIGSGAAGSVAQDSTTRADGLYSARASITTAAPSAPWGVQINQRNLNLGAGASVSVTFWARASASRDLQVVVQMGSSPYTEYVRRSFTLSTSWQPFSFSYTQPSSDSSAMLSFNMAQAAGQVWIDNAALAAEGSPPAATATTAPPTATSPAPSPTPTAFVPSPTPTRTPTAAAPTPTPVAGDPQPPVIGITSPANGASIPRKQDAEITVSATDNTGIDRVEILVQSNGYSWACVDTLAPYACSWPVPASPNTQYTITATAYDLAGNSAQHSITVTTVK
jgi:hypothetical protein